MTSWHHSSRAHMENADCLGHRWSDHFMAKVPPPRMSSLQFCGRTVDKVSSL